MGIRIINTSSFLPDNIIYNRDFERTLETSDEWISSRTGISSRRFSKDEDTSHIATNVARGLLPYMDIEKVDLVLVATFTPDLAMPSIAALLQQELGLREDVFAIDINMACSGFGAGLKLCEKYLDYGRQAILIGAEVISKTLDKSDRSTAVLFGDGGGGVVLEKVQEPSFFDVGINSNREDLFLLGRNLKGEQGYLSMAGKNVFRFAVDVVPKSISRLINQSGLSMEDVDYIVCHQANKRILESVSKKVGIPLEKFYMNLDKYGNTSAASIPIALDEMNKQGLLKQGQNIIMIGFGAGLSWASSLIKW